MREDYKMKLELPRSEARILEILERRGFEAYFVGGCVRDCLMGRQPQDWDLATNALPEQVKAVFAGYQVIETGLRHGTVTVLGDRPVEVTTYRVDGDYSDNRHPDQVVFTDDLHQDLRRRDFTINAMAYHPERGLVDDFGGQEDLESGIVRCVGEADARFSEDALRILRGLRFASVLGFRIDPHTALEMERKSGLLHGIASERIQTELVKLLCGRDAGRVLTEYRGLIAELIPELKPMFHFDQKNPHHYLDVWSHTVEALQNSVPEPAVRLALLFHDVGKPATFSLDEKGIGHFYGHPKVSEETTAAVLERLRFDRATIERVRQLVRWHDSDILPEGKSVKRWLNRLGEDGLRQLLAVKAADRGATNHKYENLSVLKLVEAKMRTVLEEGQCFTREQLAVNGDDLLALGAPEGKQIGAVLNELLELVMDEKLPNQRTVLLNRAKAMLAQK